MSDEEIIAMALIRASDTKLAIAMNALARIADSDFRVKRGEMCPHAHYWYEECIACATDIAKEVLTQLSDLNND